MDAARALFGNEWPVRGLRCAMLAIRSFLRPELRGAPGIEILVNDAAGSCYGCPDRISGWWCQAGIDSAALLTNCRAPGAAATKLAAGREESPAGRLGPPIR